MNWWRLASLKVNLSHSGRHATSHGWWATICGKCKKHCRHCLNTKFLAETKISSNMQPRGIILQTQSLCTAILLELIENTTCEVSILNSHVLQRWPEHWTVVPAPGQTQSYPRTPQWLPEWSPLPCQNEPGKRGKNGWNAWTRYGHNAAAARNFHTTKVWRPFYGFVLSHILHLLSTSDDAMSQISIESKWLPQTYSCSPPMPCIKYTL